MEETKQTLLFWQKQDLSISSMYQKNNERSACLEEHEKPEIISYLPNLINKNVLDFASGIGRFTRHFSSTANHLISVDIAPQFVEKNKLDHADCKNVTYICSDAINLNIESNSLDFIFINWLFMYLEDDETELLMKRMHSWLKEDGELFFRETCEIIRSKKTTNGYYAHYRPFSYYDSLVSKEFKLINEGPVKAYIYHFADPLHHYWHVRKLTH